MSAGESSEEDHHSQLQPLRSHDSQSSASEESSLSSSAKNLNEYMRDIREDEDVSPEGTIRLCTRAISIYKKRKAEKQGTPEQLQESQQLQEPEQLQKPEQLQERVSSQSSNPLVAELAALRAQLAEKEKQLAEKDANIRTLDEETRKQLAEKEAKIAALEEKAEKQLAEKEAKIAALEEEAKRTALDWFRSNPFVCTSSGDEEEAWQRRLEKKRSYLRFLWFVLLLMRMRWSGLLRLVFKPQSQMLRALQLVIQVSLLSLELRQARLQIRSLLGQHMMLRRS